MEKEKNRKSLIIELAVALAIVAVLAAIVVVILLITKKPSETTEDTTDVPIDNAPVLKDAIESSLLQEPTYEQPTETPTEPTEKGYAVKDQVLYYDGKQYTGVYASADGGDGLFYKDGVILTGDYGGYAYLDGGLIVLSTHSVKADANDAGILTYSITDGDHVTETLHIYMPFQTTDSYEGYNLSAYKNTDSPSSNAQWYTGFDINVENGKKYSVEGVTPYVANPDKNILYALTHGKANSVDADHIPLIIDSVWFCEYLGDAYSVEITKDNFSEYAGKYVEEQATLTRTYTEFLKEKLNCTALSDAVTTDNFRTVMDNIVHTSLGVGASGVQYEPEIIQMLTDVMYKYGIKFSFNNQPQANTQAEVSVFDIMNGNTQSLKISEAVDGYAGYLYIEHTKEVWTAVFSGDNFSVYYPDLIITLKLVK